MTHRIPQYVRCDLCSHTWVAVWLPMVMGDAAKVYESLRCPMCASDSSYHQPHNDPVAVATAAALCVDPPVPVAFEVRTDSMMAFELRLLLGKLQIGSPVLSNDHLRAMTWLCALPRQIECAASYVLAMAAKAGAQ